jgi:hypothetical protein
MKDALQLESADLGAAPAGLLCAACEQRFAGPYWEAAGRVVCERCGGQLAQAQGSGGAVAFLRALALGSGAALVSAFVWWAVRAGTGYEIGLLAIGVGLLVGRAVHSGSGGRGGLRFQLLAVFLVYSGICLNYAPDLATALRANQEKAQAERGGEPAPVMSPAESALVLAKAAGVLYRVPFMGGTDSILGVLIIGFALLQAWKTNRRVALVVTGPYQPGSRSVPGG